MSAAQFCETCGHSHSGLRCAPASEEELDRMRHYRERGTSPGNPKWYKRHVLPSPIKYDMAQRYPTRVRGYLSSVTRVYPFEMPTEYESTADYVRQFEELNRLVPTALFEAEPLRMAA